MKVKYNTFEIYQGLTTIEKEDSKLINYFLI